QAAVLSSVNRKNLEPMLRAVLRASLDDPIAVPTAALSENLMRLVIALGENRALVRHLDAAVVPRNGQYAPWQLAALVGLLDGLEQRGTSLAQFKEEGDAERKASLQRLVALFAAARSFAGDDKNVPDAV